MAGLIFIQSDIEIFFLLKIPILPDKTIEDVLIQQVLHYTIGGSLFDIVVCIVYPF